MNVKVQIQTRCEHCDGEAYILVGEAIDANGNLYPRYLPCGYCQGSGEQARWVSLLEFLDLLEREASKDPMAPDWLELARRKPMTQYRDSCEAAGI
jgi:hypothetical protein